ncbi:hypothetical protein HXX76_008660 [Chlamydomonas incerta]|uniref:Uncharacterized protein n=1 Tax=Chlamydomonas incerta TaxID=51695 RepID=A0A835T5N7_CHLIN|nr:hypothetical protein HXX76_008660 [Chlamydomonas incerta]|eukprot:KAG2432930.1 hypothetical protein HXX76_008660 [Chlamydomonas incerta]
MAATCFDATLWVADLPLQDLVVNLQADLGLVLPQDQLLQMLNEALTAAAPLGAAAEQQQPHNPQQQQSHTSAPAAAAKAAVQLDVPHSAGSAEAAGGGGCPPPASMVVLLPPSRFGGREVTVRLPVNGGMRRIGGPEAQRQCLSMVSCMHRQLEDMRGELRGARSELRQLREERVLMLKELELSGAGGEATGAQTLRSQYGLAGAPPPLSVAAAKRQRTGPAASFGHLLGEGGLGGGLAGRSGSGLMGGLGASQSQQAQQQPLPLMSQASGGLYAGVAAPAAGAGAGAAAAAAAARVDWGLWSEPQSLSQGSSQAPPQAQPQAVAHCQGGSQSMAAPGAARGTVAAAGATAAGRSSPDALALEHTGPGADGPSVAVAMGQERHSAASAAPGQEAGQQDAAAAPQARDPSRVAVSIRLGGGPPGRGRGGARGAWPRR